MKIKSLEFYDYKSFPRFTITAREKNILVGPNNAGKSTSLDALRIAFDVLRSAQRRSIVLKSQGADGVCATYFVPHSTIQTDLRYCVHNFEDRRAKVEITIGSGAKFVLKLAPDADAECYLVTESAAQKGSHFLSKHLPLNLVVVPTLSPLEQNEEVVQQETVERNRYGRLASRNFRNFWLHKSKDEFREFSALVEKGWPGIHLMPPEIERGSRNIVRMYFRHGPNVREVQWAGFGFQVWMQTMMHLSQANKHSVLVLDEPDIYLHPDLQHKLLELVSEKVGQFFIATHSTEIINAADPGDVLIVRQTARSARRIRNDTGYSDVYAAIGSSENAQFARLARTRKVLYFEGSDSKLLSKISKAVGGLDFLSGSSVTLMKTDGFSNWGKVSNTAWVFKEFFELDVQIAALFDRDYRSDEAVDQFEAEMSKSGTFSHVLPCKEIENVLLVPRAIVAAIRKHSASREIPDLTELVLTEFERLLSESKDTVFGLQIGHFIQHRLSKNSKLDTPELSSEFQKTFTVQWADQNFRKSVVPGKVVFSSLSKFAQEEFGVTLTTTRVADELILSDFDPKVLKILSGFKEFFGS